MHTSRKKIPRARTAPDYVFIAIVGLLTIFGLVILASASSDLAKTRFGDSYYYLTHQLLYGLSFGIAGFVAGSLIYHGRLERLAMILLALNVVALILVFTPLGFGAKGASRWLSLGGASIQPGEFAKLTFIVYLAAWISRKSASRTKSVAEGLIPFLLMTGVTLFLILIQPAMTTALILGVAAVATYFASGARISFIAIILLAGILGATLLVYLAPYRFERVLSFFNPERDVLGESYHQNQALIAMGSGGATGVGYGKSTTKLNYLPEPIGDSIFAVIGEELGFVGTTVVILCFGVLVWRGFVIAHHAAYTFGKALTIGFTTIIGLQAFINMAAISGLIPLTGVPLPFVSYGGTALATFLTMSGIIVNVSRYRNG